MNSLKKKSIKKPFKKNYTFIQLSYFKVALLFLINTKAHSAHPSFSILLQHGKKNTVGNAETFQVLLLLSCQSKSHEVKDSGKLFKKLYYHGNKVSSALYCSDLL